MKTPTTRTPRQLPLLPADALGPPDDPVGEALGLVDDDPDVVWPEVMGLFARIAVRAYHAAQAKAKSESESETEPQC